MSRSERTFDRRGERRGLRMPSEHTLAVALERAGMERGAAIAAARTVGERAPKLGPEPTRWLVEGVRLALEGAVHAGSPPARIAQAEPRTESLQELERLMGGFAGELTKLDELLEVLAAYVKRMRTSSSAKAKTNTTAKRKPRVLH